ncbi:MAG: cell division protein FtsK, partial [Pseudoxanthomonas spadix]
MAKALPERGKSKGAPAARRTKPSTPPNPRRQRLWRDLALIVIAPVLLYLLACLFTYSPSDPSWTQSVSVTGQIHNVGGRVGATVADLLLGFFGYVAFLLPIILGAIAWIALFGMDKDGDGESDLGPALRLVGMVGFLISASGLLYVRHVSAVDIANGPGGILGRLVGRSLEMLFGALGGNLFLLVLFLVSVTLATGLSWFAVMERIGQGVSALPDLLRRGSKQAEDWQQTRTLREQRQEVRKADAEVRAKREPVKIEPPAAPVVEKSERAKRETQIPLFHGTGGTADGLPPLALLDDPKPQAKGYSEETLEVLSRQIEFKLKDFRIDVQVVGAYPGPVITRFELEPAPGVKVSQISSLDKDIARGLSVKAVRVVDVIPGKSVIGLEIPNTSREMIYLSELLRSKEYDKSASPLTLALGKGIAGQPTVADLARMPHLLVAGTTGSGKSVAVNAMVLSLLYKASPKELRMLMIDPKMLELSVYEGIPHLLAPVVTDMKEAANGLRWCVAEMERRYK